MEQKRQTTAVQAVETKVDNIQDIISLDTHFWREDCRKIPKVLRRYAAAHLQTRQEELESAKKGQNSDG